VAEPPRGWKLGVESLVVLTQEAALAATLKVLGSEHDIITITAEADLDEALLGRHTGVAILDAAATSNPIEQLTARLRAQFPDLVLIVAGRTGDQSALARQITLGTVYRFLHKPVSEQRVTLFVEAAWRRHTEEQAETSDLRATAGAHAVPRHRISPGTLVAGGALLGVLIALGAWLLLRKPETLTARPAPAAVPGSAGPARDAQVQSQIDKLLSAAEEQLAAQHLEEAQKLIEGARVLKPDHIRVAFLSARLAKERERAVLTQARKAASSGKLEQAIAVLDGASQTDQRSTLVAEARQQFEHQKLNERVADYLAKAADRLQGGQVIEPAEDSARFFIESARTLAPDNPGVHRAEGELADRVAAEARSALAAGNSAQAQHWIEAAADSGVSSDVVAALSHDAQQLQVAAKADALARLAQLFNQRMTQGDVVDPPADSAKFYLRQLMQSDAANPSTLLARTALANRSLDEARGALHHQDFTGARRWLAEAHEAGAADASTASVEREVAAAQDAARRASEPVGAGTLHQTHYSAPKFPVSARERGISGWVEMEFVVKPDGSVSEVLITAAEPSGIFEQAAIDAVRKWRYQPVVREGAPVQQRARLRMKFALEN
jgi:TonB family protein